LSTHLHTSLSSYRGNSNQGQTGFIDNETWLVDFDSYTCANNAERACWVEAGYGTFYDYDTNTSPNIYFWADSRPLYLGYTEHPLYPVSSSDKNVIINIYTGSNYNWYVNMYPSYSQYYQEQSTDNEMVPAHIELGQELQGTSGASAPTASFQFNGYYIGPADKLAFDYFTRGQDYSEISRPPYGRWVAVPDSQNSGGEWITSCC
jgi:hypothetical protein